MKKTLALVLAFALVFSTISVAFAADATTTTVTDAKICTDLGILQGDGSGVTDAFLAAPTTRIQAAIMTLRLAGKEAEAKAYAGTANFADGNIAWAEGKAIMAYLKANPQYGWAGDGVNFKPNDPITAQQYYKVLLESLGYKQTTATVAGDFTFADTLTFAAAKGLVKAAAATTFTNNDVAMATVEALKATVKDTTTTLVASLVAAGKVDPAKAAAAGLTTATTTPTTGAAVLDTAVASANDKVELGFDAAVDKAFAENTANFKIVVKGSTTALEVKSAALASDPKFVVLTTAAQTGGAAYTVTVGTKSINFAGAAKVTGAPEVDTVKCIDTNTVEVVFTKAMDRATAEDVANYTLDKSATVKSAELWAAQDDTRKTVKLTTEGVANSKVYTLKIANVKSADMVAIKTVSKTVTGITDTTAPKVNGAITVSNNERIIVNFTDNHGVDKASAENVANWSIKDAAGTELKIESITAKDDDDDAYGYFEKVEIATAAQTSGAKYTVTINNLADGSVAKNVAATLTKNFTGKSADTTAPTVASCAAISDTAIRVEFSETNRLDNATLTNIANYTFEKDITVTKAEIIRPTKPDTDLGKTVILTTTAMDSDIHTYKLTITGIADEFGNVIKTYNKSISYHAEDTTPPFVSVTEWTDLNTVVLTFNETLDAATAEDPANYVVNGGLGVVTKAEIGGDDYDEVTLTTPDQAENTKYTVTINSVKDLVGNANADAKAYFTSQRDGLDVTRPTIESVDLVSDYELHVTFSEKVKTTTTASIELSYNSTASSGIDSAIGTASDTDFDVVVDADGNAVLLDDERTVVFKAAAALPNNDGADANTLLDLTGNNDKDFRIDTILGVTDKANNAFVVDTDDYATFSGNATANEAATIESIEQTDPITIVVTFDKPVYVSASEATATAVSALGTNKTFAMDVDTDDDDTDEAESTLTLTASGPLAADVELTFNFASGAAKMVDLMGVAVENLTNTTTTKVTTTIDDEDGPAIEYVEAVNDSKLVIHYNEDLSVAGTYKIYEDGKTTELSGAITATAIDGDDSSLVNLTLDPDVVTAGDVFQVKPSAVAKDLANNSSTIKDVEFSFVASAVETRDYITGVEVVDARNITVNTSSDMSDNMTITVEDANGNIIDNIAASYDAAAGDDSVDVPLLSSLIDGARYTVTVNADDLADTDFGTYEFVANIEDGAVEIDEVGGTYELTFSAWDTDNYVVKIVYDFDGNGTIAATETYYVVPTAADKFDLDVADWGTFSTGLVANFNLDDMIDSDNGDLIFSVEIYKTLAEIDASVAAANLTTYFTGAAYLNNGTNVESAPVFTAEFTIDN